MVGIDSIGVKRMKANDSLEAYSDFFNLMGHYIVKTPSSLWFNVRPFIFQAIPAFSEGRSIAQEEVRALLKSNPAVACRWFTRWREGLQNKNFLTQIYIACPPYDFSCLEHKARNQTRRGLEQLEIKKIDRNILDLKFYQSLYIIYQDNVKRLGLFKNEKKIQARWCQWLHALKNSSDIELWCAFREGRVIAFTVILKSPWGAEIMLQRSLRSGLSFHPNNALIYTICKDAFESNVPLVSFGLQAYSAENDNGLDHFKTNMGFKSTPLLEHFEWHPFIRPFSFLLNSQTLRGIYRFFRQMGYRKIN